jgi:predicted amidohydrolase
VRDLIVTLVQADLAWQNPAANTHRLDALLAAAGPLGDLVVLPEMSATGFTMRPPGHAAPMDGPTVAWLRAEAAARGTTLCGSLAITADGHGVSYAGDSGAHHPLGHALLDRADMEGVASVVLPSHGLAAYREQFPTWQDADPFTLR